MSKWKIVQLDDVCYILDSQRVPITKTVRRTGIYPYYYGANGIQDYVDDYIFNDELVLLAEDGGNFGSKDKPIAYRVSGKCWVNNHAHVLKPKEVLDVDYLCYSIMYCDVSSLVNGATRQKLNQATMRKIKIPLPPLDEQKRIADTLDRCRELIDIRKKQLDELDTLVKSRFVEMFGAPVENPMGWEVVIMADITLFLTSGSRGWSKYFANNGQIFLTIKNVKNCKLLLDNIQFVIPTNTKEAQRTKVQSGDLLISC